MPSLADQFIDLPNGERVKATAIVAIRSYPEIPANPETGSLAVKPRVTIEYTTGASYFGVSVAYFNSEKERDAFLLAIYQQMQTIESSNA